MGTTTQTYIGTVRPFAELTGEALIAAGGKGGSLARLRQAGFPVPDGFVVLPGAFVEGALTPESWEQVRENLATLRAIDPDVAFAVRSSAAAEDSAQTSFAGEFTTVLNVRGDEELRGAIEAVYGSRHNERVAAYSRARGVEGEQEIAVVVQRLVLADCSGVLFTANPVTGRREEALVNATWGLGEAIVSGLVTPDTLTVDKASGRVLKRETADKRVMTVRTPGGTMELPVPEEKREAPVLTDSQAGELVGLGGRIEALYGVPVDVEWTMVGETFAIVQARPITALPDPEPAPPSQWHLPPGAYSALRNNIVELMADPLSPLFRTLGLSAVNESFHRVLATFFGGKRLMPENIIVAVNDYAYYNGSLRPGQIAWLALHGIGIARRMFSGAIERWLDEGRPRYVATTEHWRQAKWRDLPSTALVGAARELMVAAVDAYASLVSGIIPGAWISEGIFTFVYDKLAKRHDDPPATTYLLGYDSTPIRAEKALYDLATWARGRAGLAAYLEAAPAARLAADLGNAQAPEGVDEEDWRQWQSGFQTHLEQYGHTIYNLDFANPVPADDPAPLLEVCKMHLAGAHVSPHARQQAAAERREQATQALLSRAGGWRLRLCRRVLATAQRFAPLRENGLADIGLGYPVLRQALRELGGRFAAAGMIERADDVYWLEEDEVALAAAQLDRGEGLRSLADEVARSKAAWRASKRVVPPLAITRLRLLGREVVRTTKPRAIKNGRDTLNGVAASPGRVTAVAIVIDGPEDFAKMRTGNVLVAPLTTPAWTPLFARAAAIVTDVGGPLSHGSIVAREYGVPAVLGTGEATKRIRSGQVVTVDGSTGVVLLSPE
jgi:pyruvate,water dikinase